ncbi:MAG: porin [Polyangiaceae bacterium]
MPRHRHLLVVPLVVASLVGPRAAAAADPSPPAPPPPPPASPPLPAEDTELVTAKSVAAPPSAPTSGWHSGTFFLRDPDDNFRLYVQGRVHVDYTSFYGPGVNSLAPANALKDGFFLRRVRLEMAGEFFQRWQWQLSAEMSSASTTSDVGAQNVSPTCGYNASGVETCVNQSSPVEAATVNPIPTDNFVNYAADPAFNIQVGQYLLPFSFENRISDNTTPFMERSLPVRNLGAPTQRDIGAMVWGDLAGGLVGYSLGIYNGDGPNRPNQDDRFDGYARVVLHPFVGDGDARWTQFGLSGRIGSRDPKLIGYDLPSLTTQSGYVFWKPNYKDSYGRINHIIPSEWQSAAGADMFLPLDRFDITAEAILANLQTREAIDGAQLSPYTQRTGALYGFSSYVQVGVWVLGDRSIVGFPGTGKPLHIDLTKPSTVVPGNGVEILAKWEHLAVDYEGASRGGVNDKKTPNGTTEVEAFSLGVNYWATKHVRATVNYVLNTFPDGSAGSPIIGNLMHEVAARVGVQF